MDRASVLLVDGDVDTRQIYSLYLRHLGYTVIEAVDGAEALVRAQEHRPTAVIMELWLRGVDGLEVIRRLRADSGLRDTSIVVLTTRHLESDRAEARQAGCTDYLTKPVEPKQLLETLVRLVRPPST
jgi:CheY-like chemotaxis protein